MTLKRMRKEEVGVQSRVVNSAPVVGCKEISTGKTATTISSHEWKVIHVIIMVIYRTNSGSKTGTKKSKL